MQARALRTVMLALAGLTLGLAETPANRLTSIHQHARSILDGGRVLMVTLAPGREDLVTVAYYRNAHQAQVRVAYLTNGEATIADDEIRYPHQVAAELRRAAAMATEALGADHSFLNLPHPDGIAADSILNVWWPTDSLREGLRRELNEFLPDLVLVDGLDRPEVPPSVSRAVRAALEEILRRTRSMRRHTPAIVALSSTVPRGVGDWLRRERSKEVQMAVTEARALDSLYVVWRHAVPVFERGYTSLPSYPNDTRRNVGDLRSLLRRPIPAAVSALDSQLRAYARDVRLWKVLPRGKAYDAALQRSIGLLGEIDRAMRKPMAEGSSERRMLVDWRASLEDIRLQLLDPEIYWRVSDSVLTNLQLAYLTIDSVHGLDRNGQTQVYFPMVQRGWIVNEGTSQVASYVPGMPFRILSGRNLPYDLPRELAGLQQRRYRTPWYFFVVHQSSTPERSFSYRLDAGFLGAPRFSVDALWPMAFASNGDRIVVRLSNHSRDGVRDSLRISDDGVTTDPMFFRLSAKGTSVTDTLALRFSDSVANGTYVGTLQIAGQGVGRFIYRKFPIAVDDSRSVALLGTSSTSVGAMVLRRLGVSVRRVDTKEITVSTLQGSPVAFLPEWSGSALSPAALAGLRSFVEAGGHLVVMAQHPAVVRALPGGPIVDAIPDGTTDSTSSFDVTSPDGMFSTPNDLTGESWGGWVNRRVPHRLTLRDGSANTLATIGPDRIPAILQWRLQKGLITYVNLNLQHQFLNVHPAAYRLLANMLAVRP